MEGEAAASATVYMKYIDSPANMERLTASAPEGLVQESNMAEASPTHPTSELPILIPRDVSSTQLICTEQSLRSKLVSSIQLINCGNWRTALEN